MPRHLTLLVSGLLLIGVVGFILTRPTKKIVRINRQVIVAEQAQTPTDRAKGLGGRDAQLSDHQGMLFEFDRASVLCFWMKDMRFDIDMIWINPNKQVTHIESDVSPSTFPENFCPTTAAKYVLEVRAGLSNQLGLKVGDTLRF